MAFNIVHTGRPTTHSIKLYSIFLVKANAPVCAARDEPACPADAPGWPLPGSFPPSSSISVERTKVNNQYFPDLVQMGKPMQVLCSPNSATNPAEPLRHVGEPGEQTKVAPLHTIANPKCGMNKFWNYIAAIESR